MPAASGWDSSFRWNDGSWLISCSNCSPRKSRRGCRPRRGRSRAAVRGAARRGRARRRRRSRPMRRRAGSRSSPAACRTQTEAVSEELKGPRSSRAAAGARRLPAQDRPDAGPARSSATASGSRPIDQPGRATAAVLAEAIPAIVRAFPWPKSMRWGEASASTESLRWVRPLQGIVALLGERGRRVRDRRHQLRRGHGRPSLPSSRPDHHRRRARLCREAARLPRHRRSGRAQGDHPQGIATSSSARRRPIPDEGLVAENAGLTEWPVPLKGSFDEAFLALPPELIQLTMRVNQKYFACQDEDGAALQPLRLRRQHRLQRSRRGRRRQREGARRAPRRRQILLGPGSQGPARGAGEEARPDRLPRKARHRRRQGRARRQARRMAGQRAAGPRRLRARSQAAARLAKADLVTEMVGEFPELQGVIGGYYARAQGQPRRGRQRDPRPLQAGGAGRRGPDRSGHGRGQHRRQARHARRLLLDRREADRLARPLRAAPRRLWASCRS